MTFNPLDKLNDPWTDTDPTKIQMSVDPTVRRMSGYAIHGDTPFDVPFISEISDGLWQGGCEEGLVLPGFINHVISLYPWERYKIIGKIDTELYVRLYDSVGEGFDKIDSIARWVNERRQDGNVLVHCQAGLNRSSLVAARALMLDEGISGDEAIFRVRKSRSTACLCNPAFEKYLRSFDTDT